MKTTSDNLKCTDDVLSHQLLLAHVVYYILTSGLGTNTWIVMETTNVLHVTIETASEDGHTSTLIPSDAGANLPFRIQDSSIFIQP